MFYQYRTKLEHALQVVHTPTTPSYTSASICDSPRPKGIRRARTWPWQMRTLQSAASIFLPRFGAEICEHLLLSLLLLLLLLPLHNWFIPARTRPKLCTKTFRLLHSFYHTLMLDVIHASTHAPHKKT